MLWGLADRFVDEVVAVYCSRELAERALNKMLRDEPEWEGMIEVVPVAGEPSHWRPRGRKIRAHRCRH